MDLEDGVIQGGPLSPNFYKIGTITLPMWNNNTESVTYADDEVELIAANTAEECQSQAQLAADGIVEWYRQVGLCLNVKKSEVMGFGFNPEKITVEGQMIEPCHR